VKIALAGSHSFGAAVGQALWAEGHDLKLFAPADDRKMAGLAQFLDQPLWSLNESTVRGVDLIVAAHSHDFIGARSRAVTRLGAIGYHPSLLPRHRGRDAVRWTIRMSDPVAGGSVYWLDNNVDGGPVAAQDWCFVRPGDDHHTLWRRELFPMGVRLLVQAVTDLGSGLMVQVPQDERVATWEPSWNREPIFRPELPELGTPAGFRVIANREQLQGRQ
jgi:methionyl-tRNA formyltransferase